MANELTWRAPFVCKFFHLCLYEKAGACAQLIRSYDAKAACRPYLEWYCACTHLNFGPSLHFKDPSPEGPPRC